MKYATDFMFTGTEEKQTQKGRETTFTYSCWIVAIGQDIQQICG